MRERVPPSENQTTWCSGFQMHYWGLQHGRTHTHTHTHLFSLPLSHSSLCNLFSHSFLSLLRLFVVLHLPGLFECINQSSHRATAITHLVRIRERKEGREREGGGHIRDTETMTKRDSSWEWKGRKGRRENGEVQRGSCSVFIHLLISLLTSRLFIPLTIIPFIHPSTYSASNEPCIHSFIYL